MKKEDIFLIKEQYEEFMFDANKVPFNVICFANNGATELLRIEPVDETNTEFKIIFNREVYPDYTADEFAKEFIDIVEKNILKR